MRPRTVALVSLASVLTLSLLSSGCDLTDTSGESYYDTSALASGRLLYAAPADEADADSKLVLWVMSPSGSEAPSIMGSADLDFAGPAAGVQSNLTYMISFGTSRLRVLDTMKMGVTEVGGGETRRCAAFDRSGTTRFAYMKGSAAGGFDILLRPSVKGEVVELTTDASADYGYYTPAWSHDGLWILFAKVPAGATSGTGCELWRVHPDGTGAEKLPISTDEVPTYAVFSPDDTEIFVPGDFTSYRISDGAVITFNHIRESETFLNNLGTIKGDFGYELVGSPLTGPTHAGDTVTTVRHTFPISATWVSAGDRLYMEALVADNVGDPPHEVLGVAILTYLPDLERCLLLHNPLKIDEDLTENWTFSVAHPILLP